jgi:CRISPR-associated protein Csb2
MTTIQLTFPWGRYYAHPWGINPTRLREPEWPPSPWRLLRALVSAWFRTHPGQVPSAECIALIESLGRELPEIGFSKVSFGQTVHWQPNYGAAGSEDRADAAYKNTRHENHFAAVHGPVFFRWQNVTLTPGHSRLLETLLAELTYFGRAESLCHVELCEAKPKADQSFDWCKPTDGRKISATCRDVFCPNPADFRFTDLWSRRTDSLAPNSQEAPEHLVDKLLSSDMKADGAVWRSYQMPVGWPHQWIVRTPRTTRPTKKPAPSIGPKVAHYLCFSLQCRVPLLPKFAVPLSEQFRSAANSHLCKVYGNGTPSFALFGHERPPDAEGDHQHAFYLPMAKKADRSGCLSDLHVWCPYGFTQAEIEILLRINRLNWGGGKYPVRPVLTALSKEPPIDAPFSTGKSLAKLWRSASPFVPPRYFYRGSGAKVKLKEKDRPELQLAECLRAAGIQVAGEIRHHPLVNGATQNDKPRWDIVRAELGEETAAGAPLVTVPTHRNGKSSRREMEQRIGGFFEVEFAEPVALKQPAIGHSCHFGLGLFVP